MTYRGIKVPRDRQNKLNQIATRYARSHELVQYCLAFRYDSVQFGCARKAECHLKMDVNKNVLFGVQINNRINFEVTGMEFLSAFTNLFSKTLCWLTANPGVFAAFVALGGVILSTFIGYMGVSRTIKATDEREAKKLNADIGHKDKEREIALRKEVYMETASGMISAQKYLAKLADESNLKKNSVDQLDKFFAAVAKIEIVGTNETIEKVDSVLRQFNESHFALLRGAIQIKDMENKLRVTREEIGFEYDTYHRIVALSTNEQIKQDSGLVQIHNNIVALGQKVSDLEKALPNVRLPFQKKCMAEALKVARLVYPAVIAIRSELHLTIDAERYEALKVSSLEKAQSDFDDLVNDLSSDLS